MKMKVFENEEKFYDMLWLNYQEYKRKEAGAKEYDKNAVKESFIYQYYKAKKTKTAEKLAEDLNAFNEFRENFKRSDNKFVLLCAARLLLKKGILGKDTYREVYEFAAKNEYIAEAFQERSDSDEAYEQLVYQLVCKYVNKIFLDKGYRQKEYDKNGAMSRKVSPEYIGKSDKPEDIEMMYQYYLYTESRGVYVERSAGLTEEHKALCAELYRTLTSANVNLGDICIPLYIDPSSGSGIYIIGDHNLGKLNSNGCCVYTTHFNAFDPYGDVFEDSEWEAEVNWAYTMKKFDSIEAAFEDFEAEASALEDNRRYSGYMECNVFLPLNVLEKDGLEQFLKYKAPASDIDFRAKLTRLEQQQIETIMKQEKLQKAKDEAEAHARRKSPKNKRP